MLLVGAYVAYYGWWEIRVLGGGATDDPVIETAAAVQQWLANTASSIGATGFALVLGAALLAVGAAELWRRAASTEAPPSRPAAPHD